MISKRSRKKERIKNQSIMKKKRSHHNTYHDFLNLFLDLLLLNYYQINQ